MAASLMKARMRNCSVMTSLNIMLMAHYFHIRCLRRVIKLSLRDRPDWQTLRFWLQAFVP